MRIEHNYERAIHPPGAISNCVMLTVVILDTQLGIIKMTVRNRLSLQVVDRIGDFFWRRNEN